MLVAQSTGNCTPQHSTIRTSCKNKKFPIRGSLLGEFFFRRAGDGGGDLRFTIYGLRLAANSLILSITIWLMSAVPPAGAAGRPSGLPGSVETRDTHTSSHAVGVRVGGWGLVGLRFTVYGLRLAVSYNFEFGPDRQIQRARIPINTRGTPVPQGANGISQPSTLNSHL